MKLAKTLIFSVHLCSERGDLKNEFVMIVSFRMSFLINRGSSVSIHVMSVLIDLLSIYLDEKQVIGVSEMIYSTILCFQVTNLTNY
jgi:hypothetical protein